MTPQTAPATDSTDYYYVKGRRVGLEREPSVYAVRFKPAVKEDSPLLSPSSRRLLTEESEPIAFIANYGLRVMRSTNARGVEGQLAPVARLDAEEGVDQAVLAFRRTPGSEELMFSTRAFVVQFRPDVTRARIDAYNLAAGVRIVEPTAYMTNGYVLEAPNGEGADGPVALANRYFESGLALSATPDFVHQIHTRRSATATAARPTAVASRDGEYLDQQWHLATARVIDAWDVTTGDSSIVVAVLDDGIDVDHPEFAGKVVGQFDFASKVADARPKSPGDKHGTACAGVAVASGQKAHGAAPGASLLAVKTPEFLGIADEADMFRWVADQGADVISCSWGPTDGTGATDPLVDNVRAAIHYCVTDGRGGKGIPILWAAGNGNESVSLDGYASNPDVMAVAASTSKEAHSAYSDFGPEVWVCAPSSGTTANGDRRVFTTDRLGADGYNPGDAAKGDQAGDYTNDFGGTSSATPLVAGVVALVLSQNPALTHQEVRDILRTTAVRIGGEMSYDANGHSDQFGFGRVDARAAVDAATGGGTPGPTPVPADRPTVSAPDQVSRSDAAPTFTVQTGSNTLFAFEAATRWQLFDGSHDDERTADVFYASWETLSMLSGPAFTMPDDAWQSLNHADRLYCRVHSAQDESWTGWQVSTPDDEAASAPSIEITAGVITDPVEPEEPASSTPSVSGPGSAFRGGDAPTFEADTAGKPVWALELAARSELFADESGRSSDSYWGSWQDLDLFSDPSFTLPSATWEALSVSEVLFYRIHTADDDQWNGWMVSTEDSAAADAPFLTISDSPDRSTRRRARSEAAEGIVADDIDYSDPTGGGAVGLTFVQGRLDERLSPSVLVRDLAARRLDARGEFADSARISSSLVTALQAIRDRLGAPLEIVGGYRYPALNDEVGGAVMSQHLAGRAADIRSADATPVELARIALEVLGSGIGLGLGPTTLHLDLRGERASWVYDGAAMSETDFESWLRTAAGTSGRPTAPREEYAARTRPSILGPAVAAPSAEPPTFEVNPGPYPYFGVELVADWAQFANAPSLERTGEGAQFASWRDDETTPGVLARAGDAATSVYQVPSSAWRMLGAQPRLYYRAVVAWSDRVAGSRPSLALEHAEEAPLIQVGGGRVSRGDGSGSGLVPGASRRLDEAKWRDG